jgi:hypothetical protein
MNKPSQPTIKPLEGRVIELRQSLEHVDPNKIADRVGATVNKTESGELELRLLFWKKEIGIRLPDWVAHDPESGQELSVDQQGILLYHFTSSRGSQMVGEWISFNNLPDGKFYQTAFQGYSGNELARFFLNYIQQFEQAAQQIGGRKEKIGEAIYSFQVLPKVPLAVAYWLGDEDLPSSAQVLFDASVVYHLPTDVCAIMGSMLIRKLMKAARS